ncbi:mitochondrial import receptor subunit tom40 [Echria macrotheca]|uniref:Mitochondrial import receptor subunit tom40 n=1 Tax=Echria macrotheca TaxID=438768 RepID=A0AAJ0BPT6_9PEZI|nr:mitochondrial import receptor subunit tom40 [Echria macrotheca]
MASTTESPVAFLTKNPLVSGLSDVYNSFQERRAKLGLSNPGNVEGVAREVQRDVLASGFMFSGIRAEITKMTSANPLFQVSHQFALGERMQPYSIAAMYGSNKMFAQGNLDNEGALSGRFNWRWGNSSHITKTQFNVGSETGQDMTQFEHEYTGSDFTASVKAVHASLLDRGLTGIYIGQYLQSVTPKLALGLEALWQRADMSQPPNATVSYVARYKSADWIASAQFQEMGGLQMTYWRRLSERVQAGVDTTLSFAASGGLMGPPQKEGITTFGAKYDFRMSTFRAQIDTNGKMGVLLEKRVGGPVTMTFAAEVDHVTKQHKLGLGVSLESTEQEFQEQQEALPAQSGPNIPF